LTEQHSFADYQQRLLFAVVAERTDGLYVLQVNALQCCWRQFRAKRLVFYMRSRCASCDRFRQALVTPHWQKAVDRRLQAHRCHHNPTRAERSLISRRWAFASCAVAWLHEAAGRPTRMCARVGDVGVRQRLFSAGAAVCRCRQRPAGPRAAAPPHSKQQLACQARQDAGARCSGSASSH
jgi:hypothetical protein